MGEKWQLETCLAPAVPRGHKLNGSKKAKGAFGGPFNLCLWGLGEPPPLFYVLEAHVKSQLVQEGKERLHGRFALRHPPLSKAPPLF
jgi:hypothetical protein